MNLLTIGLNHRSAPVGVRERLAFPPASLGQATCDLLGAAPLSEAAILSTCNRVEIYGLAADLDKASRGIRQFLHDHHRLDENLDRHLYEHRHADTVRHLLGVAVGIDSMVVGETEIFGQVKAAYGAAQQAGATGPALNRLFQKSFAAAKKIRSTTAITRGSVSVGSVAVELALKIFGDLQRCRVMVIGTGEMSESTAQALHSRGAGQILICSRARERAETLATRLGGLAMSFDEWPEILPGVDIVISSTAAPHPIVTRDKIQPLLRRRQYRPLFLIDIAVPRDVERGCGDLESVYLYDIDDLQQIAADNRAARADEVEACQHMIDQATDRFMTWFEANQSVFRSRAMRTGVCLAKATALVSLSSLL